MKRTLFVASLFLTITGFSQNLLNNSLNSSNVSFMQSLQPQNIQVFASNMVNNTNRTVQVNAYPQAVQRTRSSNITQRRQVRRRNPAPNNAVQVQINPVVNNDIQIQGSFSQLDNRGNAFGNEFNPIAQIAELNIPSIPVGNGNPDINLGINLPKVNFKPVKLGGKSSGASKSGNHQLLDLKRKFIKFNRKASAKLSFKKKLRIKVDECFKW